MNANDRKQVCRLACLGGVVIALHYPKVLVAGVLVGVGFVYTLRSLQG